MSARPARSPARRSESGPSAAPAAAPDHEATNDCSICLRPLRAGARRGRALPCHHEFHTACLDKWARTNQTCPICRSALLRPACSPSRQRAVTTEGHFFVLIPDGFHRAAMDDGRVSQQWLDGLGSAAIFCVNGSVRPEMALVQRTRGLDREALGRAAQTVLRFFFRHGLVRCGMRCGMRCGCVGCAAHCAVSPCAAPVIAPATATLLCQGPAPVVLHDLLVMPGHGNPLAILHASICAAACAALRLPGFVVVDAQAAIDRHRGLQLGIQGCSLDMQRAAARTLRAAAQRYRL